jgi:hypothetical protein
MPRVAIDYSKTVIYRISHKEIAGLDYVGSTTDFTRRKNKHKSNCYNPNSKHHHFKVYVTIRSNGGWDCFHMLEIKKFPCGDRREAEHEEEKCRQELKATLNMNRAFITEDEKKEYDKQYYTKYRDLHKDDIIEYQKQYREQRKDQIAEHKKEYREQHKDQIAEYMADYREQHKDQKAEHNKQYREKHKDIIKERNAKRHICECCHKTLRLNDKARHERSERHIKNAQTV